MRARRDDKVSWSQSHPVQSARAKFLTTRATQADLREIASTRNLVFFKREIRIVQCDKNFICVLTGSRSGCYSESNTSSPQLTQTDPSWIWVTSKRDEMNWLEKIFVSTPCLAFSSITFESFRSDSEAVRDSPACARGRARGHMCWPGKYSCCMQFEATTFDLLLSHFFFCLLLSKIF